ncbi:MAG: hypothetical protein A3E01_08415 [Gammaproteobacteria bacterium RIFCSPHIGHO2_12_FULL_63_22]|nr:MAG: hypothetical protein A3E01_08415 [Gammaproteobacteria bacterium RIFCSPHIGHO2_12_FULL_63_22]
MVVTSPPHPSRRDPAFSRNGSTSPFGKLTEQIPAIRLSGETKAALEHEARRVGLPLQEFVRELLVVRAHGEDTVKMMYARRVVVVSGKSRECS